MSDIPQLTEAMLGDRSNDAIRLALAQAYEEDDYPDRADFIRVQLELAALDPYHLSCTGDKCPVCSPLRARESALRSLAMADSLQGQWFPGWSQWRLTTRLGIFQREESTRIGRVARGFIREIKCDWNFFISNHKSLFWHPQQSDVCANCDGDGEFTSENGDPPYGPCPACGGKFHSGPFLEPGDAGWDAGTGRIPRKPTIWMKCQPCDGAGGFSRNEYKEFGGMDRTWEKCLHCQGRRQIEHSVLTTAQPLERVVILDPGVRNYLTDRVLLLHGPDREMYTFLEKTCSRCGGTGRVDGDMDIGDIMIPTKTCGDCIEGVVPNVWVSSKPHWPGVEFSFAGVSTLSNTHPATRN